MPLFFNNPAFVSRFKFVKIEGLEWFFVWGNNRYLVSYLGGVLLFSTVLSFFVFGAVSFHHLFELFLF